MQPRSHGFVIAAALAGSRSGWHASDEEDLLDGHRDEDDLVLFGRWRFRAAGLSHTYKPAAPRFGELFAPSAKDRMLACIRRARSTHRRDRAAWWLGRACHLLGDMAVPARTRGVWHLAGDPLETFLETESHAVLSQLAMAASRISWPDEPGAIADALANASAKLPADTTRTPWGRAVFERFGRGTKLGAAEVLAQACVIVPLAVEATAALLRTVPPPR
jgi:hypothetical protein